MSKHETRREVAERIAGFSLVAFHDNVDAVRAQIVADIETALLARDERAAKIAEAMRPTGGRMWTDEQNACFSALTDCAANIRNEKTEHWG